MMLAKHTPKPDFDSFVYGMLILYLLQPSKSEPDLDGMYDLGEINGVPEKNWTKSTPYSPAVTR